MTGKTGCKKRSKQAVEKIRERAVTALSVSGDKTPMTKQSE